MKRRMHNGRMRRRRPAILALGLAMAFFVTAWANSLTALAAVEVTPLKDYSDGDCVQWAKDRALELLDITLPRTGYEPSGITGAVNWWYNLDAPRGHAPARHALALWSGGGNGAYDDYGHVAFVEEVAEEDGQMLVTLSEGGFSRYPNGWRCETHTSMERATYHFLGYIYIDEDFVPSDATLERPVWPKEALPGDAPEEKTAVMYRLYNPNTGEHIYTEDALERTTLSAGGWKDEGEAWEAPLSSDTPVYRLYNPYSDDHHYTMSLTERNQLVIKGWQDEGIGWYSDDKEREPLFRLFNPNAKGAGAHHYTLDANERDQMVSDGWEYEGQAWFGL